MKISHKDMDFYSTLHKLYIPTSGVKVLLRYLCCCWHPMLATERDLRGPCHSWHRSGSGTQSREGCYWLCMCEWKGGRPLSSTLGCWSRVEWPHNTAGHRAPRRGREPMIPPLYPDLFAPVPLALESWVHLPTVTMQRPLGENNLYLCSFILFHKLYYTIGFQAGLHCCLPQCHVYATHHILFLLFTEVTNMFNSIQYTDLSLHFNLLNKIIIHQ